MQKYVYFFGGGKAEGKGDMKDVLGGKGAGLAEMTNAALPVPPGFTISTEVCRIFTENKGSLGTDIQSQMNESLSRLEKLTGQELGSTGEAAAGFGAFRCQVFDARHDGHDSESRT